MARCNLLIVTGPGAARLLLVLAIVATLLNGCSRRQYRVQADRDAERLVSDRVEAEFRLTDRPVAPASHSRMADLADPDCGPLPPDDPSASRYMSRPYRSHGSKVWRQRGSLEDVEYEHWRAFLPANQDGSITLNRRAAMELALLHSRDYQTAVESVYLDALPVALQRFNFDTQWSGGAGLLATRTGNGPPNGSRTLGLTETLGMRQRFASGGQLLADFSNAMVWEFSGGGMSTSSLLSFQYLQPLMRGAFREIQLEPLTQTERNLLYSVRDFARFRQTFFITTVGTNGYLGLLEVAQAIRNQESNLESLRRNLEEHEALAAAGLVSQFQVDQVYQDFEQGRLSLLTAQAAYATALDRFKLQLGLPPTLEATLDDSDLQQFELNNPVLDELTRQNEDLRIALLQFDEVTQATPAQLAAAHQELLQIEMATMPVVEEVEAELLEWKSRLAGEQQQIDVLADIDERRNEFERRLELADRLTQLLDELVTDAATNSTLLQQAAESINGGDSTAGLSQLNIVAGQTLRQLLTDLFVIQTQVRVFLVDVRPLEISETRARWIAEMNRLDLRNELARVVDAYRRTEVAADLLEADLDLALQADLGTDPGRRNPLRFDSSSSRMTAGLQFDGPLNRMAERNVYRSSQIAYQQSRRDFMEARDGIAFEVRTNLRVLNRERFQFEITRQQLITAARQVEEAQLKLRSSTEPNSNLTRDLLTALQTLLRTRNGLIGSWVSYETSRMEFYRSLGVLYVDDNGIWINDGESFDNFLDTTVDASVDGADVATGAQS
jgi:outer membrane protein TolC